MFIVNVDNIIALGTGYLSLFVVLLVQMVVLLLLLSLTMLCSSTHFYVLSLISSDATDDVELELELWDLRSNVYFRSKSITFCFLVTSSTCLLL